ncbi:MAG: MBL fold metallo-hydrolase [Candidatus Nitrosoabyssus spongiisocia]|nr:MAG: MBL fold metallo-hydrolase [Nitrosopumilaceae archaeon AB1(1)]
MIIHQLPVGSMQNFTYLLYDDTKQSIVIDPSWDLDKIHILLKEHDLSLRYIVNTHHHHDHTVGNGSLAQSTGAQIIQHSASEMKNDIVVSDSDMIEFGNSALKVLHTPGHSKDSMCLVDKTSIFSGDTLFVGSCGRVDLSGGDATELYHSLFDVLYNLDDNLMMYPGHDYGTKKQSTLLEQKKLNPVFQKQSLEDFLMLFA